MNKLTIVCEVEPGTSLEDAAQQAVNLSRRLGVNVRYTFNGNGCLVSPHMSAADVMALWERARKYMRDTEQEAS